MHGEDSFIVLCPGKAFLPLFAASVYGVTVLSARYGLLSGRHVCGRRVACSISKGTPRSAIKSASPPAGMAASDADTAGKRSADAGILHPQFTRNSICLAATETFAPRMRTVVNSSIVCTSSCIAETVDVCNGNKPQCLDLFEETFKHRTAAFES